MTTFIIVSAAVLIIIALAPIALAVLAFIFGDLLPLVLKAICAVVFLIIAYTTIAAYL